MAFPIKYAIVYLKNILYRETEMIRIIQFKYCVLLISVIINICFINPVLAHDQKSGKISGIVVDKQTDLPIIAAEVVISGTGGYAISQEDGSFLIDNLPVGPHILEVHMLGYKKYSMEIEISHKDPADLRVLLHSEVFRAEKVVVTATRTIKYQRDVPIIVNITDQNTFQATNSLVLCDAMSFQTGLRVENNCQNCGFTQVRINGMEGAYAQILIDSKPVFSALSGVYGLEHIPENMVERVEVIKGGGSALFGANAVAGTVNIITREPSMDAFTINANSALINGEAGDNTISLNASLANNTRDYGLYTYGFYRSRDPLDMNNDGFTEIPRISNLNLGLSGYYRMSDNGKLKMKMNFIDEDRRGGSDLHLQPHEAEITESIQHRIFGGEISYDHYLDNQGLDKFNLYITGQQIYRDSYYGAGKDPNAYGQTDNTVASIGSQYSKLTSGLFGYGNTELVFGVEYNYDYIYDIQPAYNRLLQQNASILGIFGQSDWKMTSDFTMLLGLRLDKHNLVDDMQVNPRINLLYSINDQWQLRGTFGTGFRGPQAFDEDLHISNVGNQQQTFVLLSDDLQPEYSQSYSASIDFTESETEYLYGFTLDGFYTDLANAFVLEEVGLDNNSNIILKKRNSSGAVVAGTNLEGRFVNEFWNFQIGITYQKSIYKDPVEWTEGLYSNKIFRTPDLYGYFILSRYFSKSFNLSFSGVLTGPMNVPHYSGYIDEDRLEYTNSFFELNIKTAYIFSLGSGDQNNLVLAVGIQNLFNSYQSDFDKGPNRDSGYMYGPMRPRTFFVSLKLGI